MQKNEIIHLSGCDCSGKTTICTKLSKKTGYPIKHFDKPKSMLDAKNEYFNFIKFLDKSYICDRLHDGEWVYAPMYRGYTADYLPQFEKKLRRVPYLFVNTTASLDTLLKRANQRGEDFVKLEDFKKVVDLFDKYLFSQSMPYIKIDTELNDSEFNTNKILEYMIDIRDLHKKNKSRDIYFGNLEANYLVIINNAELIDEVKFDLLEKGIFYKSWFTTNESKDFVNIQKDKLPNLEKVLKF